jgi:hypothetical protein
MSRSLPPPAPIDWPRADPAELARFDPRSKACTMNCGPSSMDPRSSAERMLLCEDCLPASCLERK